MRTNGSGGVGVREAELQLFQLARDDLREDEARLRVLAPLVDHAKEEACELMECIDSVRSHTGRRERNMWPADLANMWRRRL